MRPTVKTPVTSTVNASVPGRQQTYEIWKTNDLGFLVESHCTLQMLRHIRLLTFDGPKNVTLLHFVWQSGRKFIEV